MKEFLAALIPCRVKQLTFIQVITVCIDLELTHKKELFYVSTLG